MQQVAGGFLMKKNKFLFGKRSKKKLWAPRTWDIVGGHSLQNESPLDTLKRETLEEIGIKVLSARLLTSMEILDKSTNQPFLYYIYMITSWKGKVINCSKEHTSLRWFTKHELATVSLALQEYVTIIEAWLQSD